MAFSKPKHDIADLVRKHRPELEKQHQLSRDQKRLLTDIAQCRTAILGGHLEVCENGDFERVAYNSCRNRGCPKCQALAQEKWIAGMRERILDIGHFHVVTTAPADLRPLAKRHPEEVYDALMKATSAMLLELGRDRLHLTFGLTLVLHTWTRELLDHPHVHVIVSAGGLALTGGEFIHVKKYLFPYDMMGDVLRAKMLESLSRLREKGTFPELSDEVFNTLMASLKRQKWNVHAEEPFQKSTHVIQYLGRYTHRIGIANSRLVSVTDDSVTFGTKDGKTATLHPVEFLWRLVQHVLPKGFHKIRHAGLYACTRPGGLRDQARAALIASGMLDSRMEDPRATLKMLEQEAKRCPVCGGQLHRIRLSPERPRAPPAASAA